MRITSDKFIKDFVKSGLIDVIINNTIVNTLETVAIKIITAAKSQSPHG